MPSSSMAGIQEGILILPRLSRSSLTAILRPALEHVPHMCRLASAMLRF